MFRRALPYIVTLLVIFATALAQNPAANKHFEKDGLSFDYPGTWQISDQSTTQMQLIQIGRGDGYSEIRVRAPREYLKSPAKEAEAKKLIQDKYVENFIDTLQQNGLRPNRSPLTSEIAGGPAEGTRVRALLDREPGGMDSIYRVVSDRFVNVSQLGSESDMKKSADAWDMIRTTLKIAPAPEPKPSPTPTPKK